MFNRPRKARWLIAPVLLLALLIVLRPSTSSNTAHAVSSASFTNVDLPVDGPGHCLNGPAQPVNCNVYDGKQYAWLNGGPSGANLDNGTYFFAVLVPGGQNDPNDGAADNLSSSTDPSNIGPDTYLNRIFTVNGGTIGYTGNAGETPHWLDSDSGVAGSRLGNPDRKPPLIRLWPYADTTNAGNVYVLAVCYLGPLGGPLSTHVSSSACKFDAFKAPPTSGGGGPPPAADLVVTKDANPQFTRTFAWTIQKGVVGSSTVEQNGDSATFNYSVAVTKDTGTDSAWQVTGTINVLNPNGFDAMGVNVADAINDPNSICTVNGASNVTIPALTQSSFDYTCTYKSAPASNTETNTATATWTDFGSTHTSASFSVDFTFDAGPLPPNPTLVHDCITVSDPNAPAGTFSNPYCASATITYAIAWPVVAGVCTPYPNTASFAATDNSGAVTDETGSSTATVTVCGPVDLQVSKDATPSFTRTYNWSIKKSVDKTLVEQIGGTATFNYTVNVNQTGVTDSAWQVKGTISVTNPNDFLDFTGVNVTDALQTGDSNATCAVTGGTNVTVNRSSTVKLPYTCTWSGAPNPAANTNVATASWDNATFVTPHSSAQGTANFTFNDGSTGNPTRVNQTVNVTDLVCSGNIPSCTSGTSITGFPKTLTATDGSPFTSATYTYSYTVNVPTNNCAFYTNTASTGLSGTNQSASVSVEVCGPAKTGALTMGYWQNKNGQGIITGGASTGGVCNSGTWLRQYAPFQDLSSTASCSAVATYVYNIIKAANASGAAMNAMLKAQMLATALDVYFGSGQGGNPINAPVVIGNVAIDLTKICHMIDSSTGTGTCSGSYENVSSAFGGASSLTVSQMLAYAASQSNVGGTTWYGQNKATQGLAKDAFDAINNQVAFAP